MPKTKFQKQSEAMLRLLRDYERYRSTRTEQQIVNLRQAMGLYELPLLNREQHIIDLLAEYLE